MEPSFHAPKAGRAWAWVCGCGRHLTYPLGKLAAQSHAPVAQEHHQVHPCKQRPCNPSSTLSFAAVRVASGKPCTISFVLAGILSTIGAERGWIAAGTAPAVSYIPPPGGTPPPQLALPSYASKRDGKSIVKMSTLGPYPQKLKNNN